ncbi:MAG: hypothetical protein A4E19_12210 [Nitrospira sp. SG-bin1]|nr:MAG: hypothetical protein A4E19_12210 [Nitrospira sp. SG-bin1]
MKAKGKYGKWEIVRSLPEGGQAHTFLVRNSEDSDDTGLYVLKRLKNPERLGRFWREIEIGLKLAHPNLIKVINFDIVAQRPYLVCQYCEGGDLRSRGVGQGLGAIAGLKFFHSICQGVAYAHQNGVVHRDLNPKNVFIDLKSNSPVVGDFGICFLDQQGERLTVTEEAVGPRLYIAPELEDGRVEEVSQRSDVYSLGKLLYWIITGTEFSRKKYRDAEFDLSQKLHDPRMEHVNRLLDKMITTDPKARFPSAVEVLSEIEETIKMLEQGFNVVSGNVEQRCLYCGKGSYQLVANGRPSTGFGDLETFGITVRGRGEMIWRVCICNNCGNMQFFRPDRTHNPQIWD